MTKSKYYQALRTEQLNHEIKALEYELLDCKSDSSDGYWLKSADRANHAGWAVSDAIDNIFGKKYRENTEDNELNRDLLNQWLTLYFQIKDAKKQAA